LAVAGIFLADESQVIQLVFSKDLDLLQDRLILPETVAVVGGVMWLGCTQDLRFLLVCHYYLLFHLPVSISLVVLELGENQNAELGAFGYETVLGFT
jgi:hypothetical protein